MEFDDQSLDVTGVDDQRGRSGGFPGGGKGIAAGGGGILGLIIALLLAIGVLGPVRFTSTPTAG